MKNSQFLLFFLLLLIACVPIPTQNPSGQPSGNAKVFTTANKIYEKNIRTVLFYPNSPAEKAIDVLAPPIVNIDQRSPLLLEFDELYENSNLNYRAKIVHCNYDWQPSLLNDIEFVNVFNNFLIRDFDLSFNTKVPYVHYRFQLPPLKISGNYVLKVYRDGDENDLILTRRFIVYENKVAVSPTIRVSSAVTERDRNQEIRFEVSYTGYEILNPRVDVHVVLRQNFRWESALYNLQPRNVRDFQKIIEYEYFNQETNYRGYNEFRRFEMPSLRFLGFNTADITTTDSLVYVTLQQDQIRAGRPYVRRDDQNGQFIVERFETTRADVEADYAQVTFKLEAPEEADEPVYVVGAFNDWADEEENRLSYDPVNRLYRGNLLLKQGQYDYMYGLYGPNGWNFEPLEGSFQETENAYEILVYHRQLGDRSDRVVAYRRFDSINSR